MKKLFFIPAALVLLAAGCQYQPIRGQSSVLTKPIDDLQQQQANQKPDTSNWKVYHNSKLGIEVQYPPSFVVVENPSATNPKMFEKYGNQIQKDTVLILDNTDSSDKEFGTIFIQKKKTSLKAENDSLFNLFQTKMHRNNESGELVYDYFSASANDTHRTYITTDVNPEHPADEGKQIGNVLEIGMYYASKADMIPDQTVFDTIAQSVQIVK